MDLVLGALFMVPQVVYGLANAAVWWDPGCTKSMLES